MTDAELLADLDRALAATEAVVASTGPAPFAAEVPVPPDASAVDRLAGWLGRTV